MYEYIVYHKLNPDRSVIVKSPNKLTAMNAKDKACKCGLFDWGEYSKLRAKRKRKV